MSPDLENDFRKALLEDDEIEIVIRSHLYIENLLDELLSSLLPFPEEYEEMNLSYANKVRLVCAAGFDKNFKPMLLALGSIRNKFSHDLNTKIDSELVKDLNSKMHPIAREGTAKMLSEMAGEKEFKYFQQHHPRDQFTTLVLNLWVIMNGAVREAKEYHGV